jgi:hypothetical protein|tara:strand:- start:587 stop:859 length:273 start_codon:yes stop_codon:yes gene_type:complete
MKRAILGVLILFQLAWTWTLSLYIRFGAAHPLIYIPQMQKDIEYLGAWLYIVDIIVFFALFFIIRPAYLKYVETQKDASLHEPLDNKTDN